MPETARPTARSTAPTVIGGDARAEVRAQAMRQGVLLPLVLLLLLAVLLAQSEWHDVGTAAPGAVLVLGAGALSLAECVRQVRAGRRWLTDPPGPPRD